MIYIVEGNQTILSVEVMLFRSALHFTNPKTRVDPHTPMEIEGV